MGFDSATGGKMFFDSNQDAPAFYDVVNFNGDSWIKVGSYDPSPDQVSRERLFGQGVAWILHLINCPQGKVTFYTLMNWTCPYGLVKPGEWQYARGTMSPGYFVISAGTVHTNRDIFKTAYFFTQIRVDGILNNSGERFQKDAVSVSGFTGFVRWMEDWFVWIFVRI